MSKETMKRSGQDINPEEMRMVCTYLGLTEDEFWRSVDKKVMEIMGRRKKQSTLPPEKYPRLDEAEFKELSGLVVTEVREATDG